MSGLTRLALRSLRERLLRTTLTIVGVALGVAVLFAGLATGDGITAAADRGGDPFFVSAVSSTRVESASAALSSTLVTICASVRSATIAGLSVSRSSKRRRAGCCRVH